MGELCSSLPCFCTQSKKNGRPIYLLELNSGGRQITRNNKNELFRSVMLLFIFMPAGRKQETAAAALLRVRQREKRVAHDF